MKINRLFFVMISSCVFSGNVLAAQTGVAPAIKVEASVESSLNNTKVDTAQSVETAKESPSTRHDSDSTVAVASVNPLETQIERHITNLNKAMANEMIDSTGSDTSSPVTKENYDDLYDCTKDYFFSEINRSLLRMKFIPKKNYLVIPIAGGHWASNVWCDEDIIKSENFPLWAIKQAMMAQCIHMLNHANYMSPEKRQELWDSPEIKLLRLLGQGKIDFPDGTQNSYDFWSRKNIERFASYQEHAIDFSNFLAREYVRSYDSNILDGEYTLREIFDSLCQ